MSIEKTGGPAFPMSGLNSWKNPVEINSGMTLRDYFAAKAMAVAWSAAESGYWESTGESLNLDIAKCAYQMADAMLEARKMI